MDCDDSSFEERYIQPAIARVKFVPDHFDATIAFRNPHTTHGYAFYSNDLTHGSIWTISSRALNAQNQIVKNYSATCLGSEVVNVDLNMSIDVVSSGDVTQLLSSSGNRTLHGTNQLITLTPKSEFTYLGSRIQTDVAFYPDTVAWAGKGKIGQTVDTHIAKPVGFQKLGW